MLAFARSVEILGPGKAAIFPALGLSSAAGAGYGLALFFVLYVSQVLLGAVAWQIRPPPTSASPAPPQGT